MREARTDLQDSQEHQETEVNRDHKVQPDLKDHLGLVENRDHKVNLETAEKMDSLDQMVKEENLVRTIMTSNWLNESK